MDSAMMQGAGNVGVGNVGVGSAAAFRPSALLRLPYSVRNVLRRWRGTVGMMVGVGIASVLVAYWKVRGYS